VTRRSPALGIAFLPMFNVGAETKNGGLQIVDVGVPAEAEFVYVAHPEARRPSAKLSAMHSAIRPIGRVMSVQISRSGPAFGSQVNSHEKWSAPVRIQKRRLTCMRHNSVGEEDNATSKTSR
jgi:hypothetical protein